MGDTNVYLERLASELERREWRTHLLPDARLKVINPGKPNLNEFVVCRQLVADRWEFRWSWGDRIGPVDAVDEVADRIMHVLREVGAEGFYLPGGGGA